jgi:hypothetical protein
MAFFTHEDFMYSNFKQDSPMEIAQKLTEKYKNTIVNDENIELIYCEIESKLKEINPAFILSFNENTLATCVDFDWKRFNLHLTIDKTKIDWISNR